MFQKNQNIKYKISLSRIGKRPSDETISKIKGTMKGKLKGKQKIVTCPHCGTTGGISNLTRYHFDFCKHIIPSVPLHGVR